MVCVSVLLLVCLLPSLEAARNRGRDADYEAPDTGFPAHLYDADLNVRRPAQSFNDWLNMVDDAFGHGSFTVIVHGVIGAGKSRFVELICGEKPATISGTSMNGGVTSNSKAYVGVQNDSETETIYVIDTPGFGERTIRDPRPGQDKYERQAMVLRGVDEAAHLAMNLGERGAPLKRVYFLLDCARSRDHVPETLVANLDAMKTVYGDSLADHLVFVISKCDQFADRYQRENYIDIRSEVCRKYQEVFERDLSQPNRRILFIASNLAKYREESRGSIHNLLDDLIAAAPRSAMTVKGTWLMKAISDCIDAANKHRCKIQEFKELSEWHASKANVELGVAIASDVVLGACSMVGGVAGLTRYAWAAKLVAKVDKIRKLVTIVKTHKKITVAIELTTILISCTLHAIANVDRKCRNDVVDALNALHELTPHYEHAIDALHNNAL